MATISSLNLTTPRAVLSKDYSAAPKARLLPIFKLKMTYASSGLVRTSGRMHIRPIRAAPDSISDKVAESIKQAEEACSGDPASGECVAAWDEVEELSAAASHARDKKKESDPLENYCKDNPETVECRTYDN